ncbi:MAG: quinohemoprotein amine dehydrogenase maturation protein [Rhodocyclales bacterium]|nr:quinohemoprotein amine dehydrogenase maturation protein [Rhodocyclales bacterium]
MSTLQLQRHNYRAVHAGGQRILLHVPTTSLFELDRAADAVLGLLEEKGEVRREDVQARFDGAYSPGEVCDSLTDLLSLGVLADGRKDYAIAARPIERTPLNTLVLTLTTGCNLGCSYCYREDLTTPRAAALLEREVAMRGIDLLLREAVDHPRVNVVFFGGEPLTRFALLRELVAYAEEQAALAGKGVDFSLTTNATLLNDEIVEFFQAHRFGVSVSMDGDELNHDRHRITIGGKGTYKQVAQNVRRLLAGVSARPVGVRVTLARGNTDVVRLYRHLHDELGFAEVGFAPATAGKDAPFGLGDDEMRVVLDAMKTLGREYVQAARRGERHGFSNMNQLMQDLWSGTRKTLPCGAGIGLLAVGTRGDLSLCHRFTGSDFGRFGDVEQGIDRAALTDFLQQAQEPHPACRDCRARSICAGGCYHEAYVRNGNPLSPTFAHCDFVREWLDFGIECYGEIILANPAFFTARSAADPARAAAALTP